jgi:hypothetical protein
LHNKSKLNSIQAREECMATGSSVVPIMVR